MKRRLQQLQERHDIIGDVRGQGLMLGVEFVKDRTSKVSRLEVCSSKRAREPGKYSGPVELSCCPKKLQKLVQTLIFIRLCLKSISGLLILTFGLLIVLSMFVSQLTIVHPVVDAIEWRALL